MAEPNDASSVEPGFQAPVDTATSVLNLVSVPLVVVQTATAAGYGLWMVLGAALALGLYSDGRGEVLVPLSAGLVLVSLGLVATCLRLRFAPAWYGWNPVKRMMPTPEGMVAMATYLPMLALAGLARGGNDFWAIRLAGAALMLCSLATLVYTARRASRQLSPAEAALMNARPFGRTVSALFAGGLWFWLCVALQTETPIDPASPWRLVLLGVALALGLAEGLRWRALRELAGDRAGEESSDRRPGSLLAWRVAIALLSVGLPCIAVVMSPGEDTVAVSAGLAALSCVVGQCLEQRLHGRAYAQAMNG